MAAKNFPNAYLFVGPKKVGKFSTAKTFAKILQTSNNADGHSEIARQIENELQADTRFIRDDAKSLKIGQDENELGAIREINRWINIKKVSPYRLLLIENVSRMTTSAANAFLKNLEEPPEGAIVILTTQNTEDVLPTILSRVRVVRFGLVSDNELYKNFHKKFGDIDDQVLQKVINFSRGRPGKAVALLNDPDKLRKNIELFVTIEKLFLIDGLTERFRHLENLIKKQAGEDEKNSLINFLENVELFLRSRFLESVRQGNRREFFKWKNYINGLWQLRLILHTNVNIKLALENFWLMNL